MEFPHSNVICLLFPAQRREKMKQVKNIEMNETNYTDWIRGYWVNKIRLEITSYKTMKRNEIEEEEKLFLSDIILFAGMFAVHAQWINV